MDYSNAFVCLMGMGTVFFGLICLIVLTIAMGKILGVHKKPQTVAASAPAAAAPAAGGDQGALVAAVSAAIAEDLGTDVSGIHILSMKKL